MRGAADLAAWWDRYADVLPASGLEGVVADHPALERCVHAAAVVADRWVGVPMHALFPSAAARPRRAGLAERLSDWRGEIPKERFRATTALVDMLLSPPGQRVRAIARYYAPPASVVAGAYGVADCPRPRLLILRGRYCLMIARQFLHDEVSLAVRAVRTRSPWP